MPITAPYIKISLRGVFQGQQWQNVQYYEPSGTALLTVNMIELLEAYWNDIKTPWRALIENDSNATFETVYGEEIGGLGGFAEYPVPTGERLGVRSASCPGGWMPSFIACGCRLTVGTHVTRPGQKRFHGLLECDVAGNVIGSDYLLLAEGVAEKYSQPIALGIPAALVALQPIVTKQEGTPPVITAHQDVTGYLLNTFVTSQNSRKHGRGV